MGRELTAGTTQSVGSAAPGVTGAGPTGGGVTGGVSGGVVSAGGVSGFVVSGGVSGVLGLGVSPGALPSSVPSRPSITCGLPSPAPGEPDGVAPMPLGLGLSFGVGEPLGAVGVPPAGSAPLKPGRVLALGPSISLLQAPSRTVEPTIPRTSPREVRFTPLNAANARRDHEKGAI